MKIRVSLAGLLLVACVLSGAADASELMQVTVGAAAFHVEVARTPEQRERGLMFRTELPGDRGMLFVQAPGPAVFWMKNTLIPLDLLYFDSEGRLSQIVAEAPPCQIASCPLYPSKTPTVRYILEINAGEAARRGIRPGDRLRLH